MSSEYVSSACLSPTGQCIIATDPWNLHVWTDNTDENPTIRVLDPQESLNFPEIPTFDSFG